MSYWGYIFHQYTFIRYLHSLKCTPNNFRVCPRGKSQEKHFKICTYFWNKKTRIVIFVFHFKLLMICYCGCSGLPMSTWSMDQGIHCNKPKVAWNGKRKKKLFGFSYSKNGKRKKNCLGFLIPKIPSAHVAFWIVSRSFS